MSDGWMIAASAITALILFEIYHRLYDRSRFEFFKRSMLGEWDRKECAITRLESWNHKHKKHFVEIDIDDGYGATCWSVTLGGVRRPCPDDWWDKDGRGIFGNVYASEVNFFEHQGDIPPNVVFVEDADEMEEWPGLEAVIHAAIDRAEKLEEV